MVTLNENSTNEEMIKELEREEREVLQEIVFVWKKKSEE
jgi:hypothetical protein